MEEWIVIQEDEDGDFNVVDKFTGKLICTTYGNTIGEEIDLASRIAKLPEIERERDKLLNWKNETLQVDGEWDEQKVGRLLNMKLGDSIRKNIEPKVRQLIKERDNLKQMCDLQTKLVIDLEMRLMKYESRVD